MGPGFSFDAKLEAKISHSTVPLTLRLDADYVHKTLVKFRVDDTFITLGRGDAEICSPLFKGKLVFSMFDFCSSMFYIITA
jgi:hypothetical protein